MRRMRRRRRYRSRSVKTTRLFIVLAAIALAVYIATATAVGNYISQKLIAPVLSRINTGDGNNTTAAEEKTPDDTQTMKPESTASVSNEIRQAGYTLYALQVGAFSSSGNAEKEAVQLRARGGAGYVINDKLFRVIAAVYKTEEEAKTVKNQLKEQHGMDSSVYKIEIPAIALKVIASSEQAKAVRQVIEDFRAQIFNMMDISIGLDKKSIDENSARQSLNDIAAKIGEPAPLLATGGKIGTDAASAIEKFQSCIREITSDTKINGIDFSTKIKYNIIQVIFEYNNLITNLLTTN